MQVYFDIQAGGKAGPCEDNFYFNAGLGLFIIGDGLSGGRGELASRTATVDLGKEIETELKNNPAETDYPAMLKSLVSQTNDKIKRFGSGTTLELLLFGSKHGYGVHMGDGRVYRKDNGGGVSRITKEDRTYSRREEIQILVRSNDPPLNYLGQGRPSILPYTFELSERMQFLMTTDGMLMWASDAEIKRIIENYDGSDEPHNVVQQLLALRETPDEMAMYALHIPAAFSVVEKSVDQEEFRCLQQFYSPEDSQDKGRSALIKAATDSPEIRKLLAKLLHGQIKNDDHMVAFITSSESHKIYVSGLESNNSNLQTELETVRIQLSEVRTSLGQETSERRAAQDNLDKIREIYSRLGAHLGIGADPTGKLLSSTVEARTDELAGCHQSIEDLQEQSEAEARQHTEEIAGIHSHHSAAIAVIEARYRSEIELAAAGYEKAISGLESQLHASTFKLDQITTERDHLNSEIATAEQELSDLREEREAAQKLVGVKEKKGWWPDWITRRNAKVANLEKEKGQQEVRIAQLRDQMNSAQVAYESQIERASELLAEARLRQEKIGEELGVALDRNRGLESERRNLSSKLEQADLDQRALKDGYEAEIARLGISLSERADELLKVKCARDTAYHQNFQLQSESSSHSVRIGALEGEKRELVADYESRLSVLEDEFSSLQGELSEANDSNRQFSEDATSLQERITELGKNVSVLNVDISARDEMLDEAGSKILGLTDNINSLYRLLDASDYDHAAESVDRLLQMEAALQPVLAHLEVSGVSEMSRLFDDRSQEVQDLGDKSLKIQAELDGKSAELEKAKSYGVGVSKSNKKLAQDLVNLQVQVAEAKEDTAHLRGCFKSLADYFGVRDSVNPSDLVEACHKIDRSHREEGRSQFEAAQLLNTRVSEIIHALNLGNFPVEKRADFLRNMREEYDGVKSLLGPYRGSDETLPEVLCRLVPNLGTDDLPFEEAVELAGNVDGEVPQEIPEEGIDIDLGLDDIPTEEPNGPVKGTGPTPLTRRTISAVGTTNPDIISGQKIEASYGPKPDPVSIDSSSHLPPIPEDFGDAPTQVSSFNPVDVRAEGYLFSDEPQSSPEPHLLMNRKVQSGSTNSDGVTQNTLIPSPAPRPLEKSLESDVTPYSPGMPQEINESPSQVSAVNPLGENPKKKKKKKVKKDGIRYLTMAALGMSIAGLLAFNGLNASESPSHPGASTKIQKSQPQMIIEHQNSDLELASTTTTSTLTNSAVETASLAKHITPGVMGLSAPEVLLPKPGMECPVGKEYYSKVGVWEGREIFTLNHQAQKLRLDEVVCSEVSQVDLLVAQKSRNTWATARRYTGPNSIECTAPQNLQKGLFYHPRRCQRAKIWGGIKIREGGKK